MQQVGSEIIIVPIMFGILFGIVYLFFSTRNKERMALIEKGIGAEIFSSKKDRRTAPIWKVLILNIAVLMMGIGAGTLIAMFIEEASSFSNDALYPGIIFLMGGAGLFAGFNLTKNLDKE